MIDILKSEYYIFSYREIFLFIDRWCQEVDSFKKMIRDSIREDMIVRR